MREIPKKLLNEPPDKIEKINDKYMHKKKYLACLFFDIEIVFSLMQKYTNRYSYIPTLLQKEK